ncbi:MAG: hypothetical protein NTX11_00055 [Candidatus Saccharibacteria bacterium]|nr:hypothetical protein [Candidatus Saccharibacteria bacterium]
MKSDPTESPLWMSQADLDYYRQGGDPDIEQSVVEHESLPFSATALEAATKRAKMIQDGEWRSL